MNGYDYVYPGFYEDFLNWSKKRLIVNCQHHDIHPTLAYLVDGNTNKDLQEKFYFSWFGITITEQILHQYFPANYKLWVNSFGSFPIPMKEAGLGCMSWENPIWIIEEFASLQEKNNKTFNVFLEKWVSFIKPRLYNINVTLNDFFYSILSDKHFNDRFSVESDLFLNFIIKTMEENHGKSNV